MLPRLKHLQTIAATAAVLGLLFVTSSGRLAAADDGWPAESKRQPSVPRGTVTKHRTTSKIFSGAERDYWLYVPQQYDHKTPACVMIFQDGERYIDENGEFRTPIVFDNLIAQGEMPVTVGIFINPGIVPPTKPGQEPRYNRSFEYDSLGDQYARFLLKEILPTLSRTYNLSTDPNQRAICGADSGGTCAFTCAWERPDAFGKVLCHGGSFTNLRGGNIYPSAIRLTQRKPLRIYLQDSGIQLDNQYGSWPLANQQIAAALEYADYDHRVDFIPSDPQGNHAGITFPDALRWLWHDQIAIREGVAPKPLPNSATVRKRPPVNPVTALEEILVDDSPWELVAEGFKFTEGPAVDPKGNVYFSDVPANKIFRILGDDQPQVFIERSGSANGLMFGPKGLLYACQNAKHQIVAYRRNGDEVVIARNVSPNDLVVTREGEIYFTDPPNRTVYHVDRTGETRVVDRGIGRPNGIVMLPGQGTLVVADSVGPNLWMFRIEADGTLAHRERFCTMALPPGKSSGADGLTVDIEGRLYVATYLGVQVFDREGRLIGIIEKPDTAFLSNLVFAGPNLDMLYATSSDKIFRRKTKTQGVRYFDPPPKIEPLAKRKTQRF